MASWSKCQKSESFGLKLKIFSKLWFTNVPKLIIFLEHIQIQQLKTYVFFNSWNKNSKLCEAFQIDLMWFLNLSFKWMEIILDILDIL